MIDIRELAAVLRAIGRAGWTLEVPDGAAPALAAEFRRQPWHSGTPAFLYGVSVRYAPPGDLYWRLTDAAGVLVLGGYGIFREPSC